MYFFNLLSWAGKCMGLWKMFMFMVTLYTSKICFCSHRDRSSVSYHTAILSVVQQVLQQWFQHQLSLNTGETDGCAVPWLIYKFLKGPDKIDLFFICYILGFKTALHIVQSVLLYALFFLPARALGCLWAQKYQEVL